MVFQGLWGFSTVVVKTPEGLYQGKLDADEHGIIEGNICDTIKEALASVLRKASEEYEK